MLMLKCFAMLINNTINGNSVNLLNYFKSDKENSVGNKFATVTEDTDISLLFGVQSFLYQNNEKAFEPSFYRY